MRSKTSARSGSGSEATIGFKVPGEPEVVIPIDPGMKRDALYWAYIARSRTGWSKGRAPGSGPDPLVSRLPAGALEAVAAKGLVEVRIPFEEERNAWEARLFPWEYLLSRSTTELRQGRPLTVIRHLDVAKRASYAPLLSKIAMVESVPGELAEWYEVASETDFFLTALGSTRSQPAVRVLSNLSRSALGKRITDESPGLIHVAGVDTHQAVELLGVSLRDKREAEEPDPAGLDGVALAWDEQATPGSRSRKSAYLAGMAPEVPRDADRPVDFVRSEDIARILAGGGVKPTLVAFNCYNSASRTAALTVARGARHAIGFLDTIDDRLAEQFFATLYAELRAKNGQHVREAFEKSLETLRRAPNKLKGACVVLWSAESLIDQPAVRRAAGVRPKRTSPDEPEIEVIFEPHSSVNYSLLHNNRSPVEKLQIMRKPWAGAVKDIRVEITLFVGEDSFPFHATVSLSESDTMIDLTDRVIVPLTSTLFRTQCEAMRSVLAVKIQIGERVILHDTHQVTLHPVDQWTDTKLDRRWLPSFVFPRDPAVAQIVGSAHRYLMAIMDDPNAGFDGYQSVDPAEKSVLTACEAVDLQAQAIWAALLYDQRIIYINPPPSYPDAKLRGEQAPQRLRIPSEIMHWRHGTCIDLSLLICSCLEYVDIYPVVFLLNGHAFPGYWRSDTLQESFWNSDDVDDETLASAGMIAAVSSQSVQERYIVEVNDHPRIRNAVAQGHLVPLESVWLTNHSSFDESLQEGRKNIRSRAEFDSMLDIRRARDAGVTPMPMLWSKS